MKNTLFSDVPELVDCDVLLKCCNEYYGKDYNPTPGEVGALLKKMAVGRTRDRQSNIIPVCFNFMFVRYWALLPKDYERCDFLRVPLAPPDSYITELDAFSIRFFDRKSTNVYFKVRKNGSGLIYGINCPISKLYYLGGLLERHNRRILKAIGFAKREIRHVHVVSESPI